MRYLTGFIVLGWACAAGPRPVDTAAEAAELMRVSREWSDVAQSDDVDAIVAYWHDDAIMMPPGFPSLRGRAAIRELVASNAQTPGFGVRWEPLEAHVSEGGDMAYLIERNRFTYQDSTGATITESNKVVTIWRRQADGSWKNVVDIWNADPTAWQ